MAAYNEYVTILSIIEKEIAENPEAGEEDNKVKKSRGPKKSPESVVLGSEQPSKISLYDFNRSQPNSSFLGHFTIRLKIFVQKHFSAVNSVLFDEPETIMVSSHVSFLDFT